MLLFYHRWRRQKGSGLDSEGILLASSLALTLYQFFGFRRSFGGHLATLKTVTRCPFIFFFFVLFFVERFVWFFIVFTLYVITMVTFGTSLWCAKLCFYRLLLSVTLLWRLCAPWWKVLPTPLPSPRPLYLNQWFLVSSRAFDFFKHCHCHSLCWSPTRRMFIGCIMTPGPVELEVYNSRAWMTKPAKLSSLWMDAKSHQWAL